MANKKAKNRVVVAIKNVVKAAKELAAAEEAYVKQKRESKRSLK